MKKITVQYGVDSITKQVEANYTFGDLQNSDSFKGALGYRSHVRDVLASARSISDQLRHSTNDWG